MVPFIRVELKGRLHETPCHSRAAERFLLKRLLKTLPLVVLPVLFGGFTEQQIEEARVTTHKNLERFRACLMKEEQIMLDQNDQKWSIEDAADYFKSACEAEAQYFKIPLLEYLEMKNPEIADGVHLRQSEQIIMQWSAKAAGDYVKAKNAQ